jgi:hypothetical protein
MTLSPQERKKAAQRVAALLAKTTENGATEGEAIAAALKAKELMDRYAIDIGEAELVNEGFEEVETTPADPEAELIYQELWLGVAQFTDTISWIETRPTADDPDDKTTGRAGRAGRHVFFGCAGDVMFAVWLIKALENFILRGAGNYVEELRRDKARFPDLSEDDIEIKRLSFIIGTARRIRHRLLAEAKKRKQAQQSTGRDLVPIDKTALVAQEMKRRDIVLAQEQLERTAADMDAMLDGVRLGDKARFDRPVHEGDSIREIARD